MLFAVELFPLLLSLFIVAVVVLWFSIQNYKNAPLLAFIIPLTLSATIVSYISVQSILGYPIVKDIEQDSIYLSHITSADEKHIYVWLIEPNADKPRSLTIPNTDNNKKQMADAKQKTEAGVKQKIAPHPNEEKLKEKRKGGGQTEGGEFMVYDFQITGGSLKNYNPQLGLPDPNQENPGISYEGEFDTGEPGPVDSSNTPTPSTNIPGTPISQGTVEYEDLPSLTPDPSTN